MGIQVGREGRSGAEAGQGHSEVPGILADRGHTSGHTSGAVLAAGRPGPALVTMTLAAKFCCIRPCYPRGPAQAHSRSRAEDRGPKSGCTRQGRCRLRIGLAPRGPIPCPTEPLADDLNSTKEPSEVGILFISQGRIFISQGT